MSFQEMLTETSPQFLEALGEAATVGASSLQVIFDNSFQAISLYSGEVESAGPAATVQSSDVTALSIAHGTTITIRGTAYTVIGIEPDGTGLTRLLLEKA